MQMMDKTARQARILALIENRPVRNQAELGSLLLGEGFVATQASISRDLEELGVAKKNGRYVRPPQPAGLSVFGNVSAELAGENLIVVHCSAGMASAVAVKIDSLQIDGVIGTIAGDDTIFVAVPNIAKGKVVTARILKELEK